MSYVFSVLGANKVEALKRVTEELDKVVANQPIHSADRVQALAAAEAFLGVIPDPNVHQDVSVYVSGSVSWTNDDKKTVISVSVHVSASVVAKQ